MSLVDKFVKRSSEYAALFHYFPGALYEFREKIWRVRQIQGSTPSTIYLNDSFRRLVDNLKSQGILVQSCTTPKQGTSEVFPQTWVCSNPRCNRFESGELHSRLCSRCGTGELRQLPLVVICDKCGNLDAIKCSPCPRCKSAANFRLVMYERNYIGTWRIVCHTCLDKVLKREEISSDNAAAFKPFQDEFHIWSDIEPGVKCGRCRAPSSSSSDDPGKRIVPAGANVIAPAFTTTFDQDVESIKSNALTTASKEMSGSPEWEALFARIKKTFAIEEIYLANITALSCTYGYRVGRNTIDRPFAGGEIFLRADQCGAILFQFNPERIPKDQAKMMLHSVAHALMQVAGYITGLGNEAYREYSDPTSYSVLIFTPEAGGCDLLLTEKEKLVTWLKRARAIVHGCKNQCVSGCPWCLHLRTWQCSSLNRDLDRKNLADLWKERFLLEEEDVENTR